MSIWLKWRLVALFGLTALLGGGYYLHAQETFPAPAKTPEEAGEKFASLLAFVGEHTPIQDTLRNPRYFDANLFGIISRASFSALPDATPHLLDALAARAKAPQFTGHVVGTEGNGMVVEVVPSSNPKPLPLVVIAEDGGYRVDLVKTYAKLTGLQGEALGDSIFHLTGAYPSDMPRSGNALKAQCQANMKQIMLGVMQYVQDYDEVMPPARRWNEVLQPYLRTRELYTCPAVPAGKSNGYAYNQFLSQFSLAKIGSLSETVNFYETSNLNPNVFGPGTGRAFRHNDGANYAFTDGHIKWLPREAISGFVYKP